MEKFAKTEASLRDMNPPPTFDEAVRVIVDNNWGYDHSWMYHYDVSDYHFVATVNTDGFEGAESLAGGRPGRRQEKGKRGYGTIGTIMRDTNWLSC